MNTDHQHLKGCPDDSNTITARSGVRWKVVLTYLGETYGATGSLTHDNPDPLVSFYDTRYPHTEHGQFVSRYFASTLLEADPGAGLNLDGNTPDWSIDGGTMDNIRTWLIERLAQRMNQLDDLLEPTYTVLQTIQSPGNDPVTIPWGKAVNALTASYIVAQILVQSTTPTTVPKTVDPTLLNITVEVNR